eukprot:scaffold11323_cov111-Isochrysis_galbana.AAC.2
MTRFPQVGIGVRTSGGSISSVKRRARAPGQQGTKLAYCALDADKVHQLPASVSVMVQQWSACQAHIRPAGGHSAASVRRQHSGTLARALTKSSAARE